MIERYEIHTDVLVLGSGPAGAAAYISATENRRLNDIDASEIRRLVGIDI